MTLQKLLHAGSHYLCDADYRFLLNAQIGLYDRMPDEEYLSLFYRAAFGCTLDFQSPQTFNEKLQWLKLYDRKPEYTRMVDKIEAKQYVAAIIGEEHIIPTLGVWRDPNDIDFDALPNQFVLKCNHNSGLGMCICQDKEKLDIRKVRRRLRKGLKQNYYLHGREWPYKNVTPKILAEQYLSNGEGGLTDYKVHCFNGTAKLILVCRDRLASSGPTYDFYSTEWEPLNIRRPSHPNSAHDMPKPAELAEMLSLSERLAKDIPFLRTDFYIVDHRIYFSELTFFPASGFDRFVPEEWDDILGSWLTLPKQ